MTYVSTVGRMKGTWALVYYHEQLEAAMHESEELHMQMRRKLPKT